MKATIVSIASETVTTGKSPYQKAVVTYKSGGMTKNYNAVSFSNPELFKNITNLKQGDEVEVGMEKDGQYWRWTSVAPAGSAPGAPAGVAPAAYAKAANDRYESPEERAARQRLIVRQSSLSAAVAVMANPKGPTNPADVMAQADLFCDWVFEKGLADVMDMESDIIQ